MKEAILFEKLPDLAVKCSLCSHRCTIQEGKKGICRVRENRAGTLYSLVYGRLIAAHVDPIEKKPLYHFFSGSQSFSIATPGCNFQCKWCQNFEISQLPRIKDTLGGRITPPEEIVKQALQHRCQSISYTYTEPTIFFEYVLDMARLAHQEGLQNVLVSNGFMTPEMLELFHPYLDAINVDLKSFREDVYHKYMGARLQPVLDNLVLLKKLGVWVEVTTLVVPGVNDSLEELQQIARFIRDELGKGTPWHISRFFPNYQMNSTPPTPPDFLAEASKIGLALGLEYVYVGNVSEETNTHCPSCGELLICRKGYWILENHVRNGKCSFCGHTVEGVGLG